MDGEKGTVSGDKRGKREMNILKSVITREEKCHQKCKVVLQS